MNSTFLSNTTEVGAFKSLNLKQAIALLCPRPSINKCSVKWRKNVHSQKYELILYYYDGDIITSNILHARKDAV